MPRTVGLTDVANLMALLSMGGNLRDRPVLTVLSTVINR